MQTDAQYDVPTEALYDRQREIYHERNAAKNTDGDAMAPQPVDTHDRSKNALRPTTFAEVIGQEKAVNMMRRVVDAAKRRGEPMDHVLLVGASGTGKSTFSHVIANELGVDCYEVEAPVTNELLLALRTVMKDGDILRIEEIHQQAHATMNGRTAASQPEVLYSILEDRVIATPNGLLPFPEITVIGTTTDEGMLPDPFLNRFPLRPRLEAYSDEDIGYMAVWNARQLGLEITIPAAVMFAAAARGVPRQVNNYVRNAAALATGKTIDEDLAHEVLADLNGVTRDGLTPDMQGMLTFLYTRGRRTNAAGDVSYQASVNSIATAIGKSRDSKAVCLRVEPFLIQRGWIEVGHGGRKLTDAGIVRAQQLLGGS